MTKLEGVSHDVLPDRGRPERGAQGAFSLLLRRLIRYGCLTYIDPAGRRTRFEGLPMPELAAVTIRLRDRAWERRLAFRPKLAFGEAIMEGALVVEEGSLYDLLALAGYNSERLAPGLTSSAGKILSILARRFHQFNPLSRAHRNVAHHYDLSAALYDLFLDLDRQYSCAYFARPDMTLEEAQAAKKRHIGAKLLLSAGHRVLDIGSGWGGLALSLASSADVDVTGITLSREQLEVSRNRAREAGVEDRVRFKFCDYREVEGVFDRIVSVGMFEHVGLNHYARFFRVLRDRLAPQGVALLHAIGRADGPGVTNPWIRKYIFPGGYVPALSEALPAIERSGLFVTDIEILHMHYAETLKEWRRRFLAARESVAKLYDERFCRMWEFYLAGAEVAFRYQNQMVFQIQLARHPDAVPRTRDYIYR